MAYCSLLGLRADLRRFSFKTQDRVLPAIIYHFFDDVVLHLNASKAIHGLGFDNSYS